MLTEAAELFYSQGWLVVDDTASPGLTTRLGDHVDRLLEGYRPKPKRRVSGFNLPTGLGGMTFQPAAELTVGLRVKIAMLLDQLNEFSPDAGLLITIDEIHSGIDDLRELAIIVQHLIREDRNIALVMAGLPSAVSDILRGDSHDRVLTFLRRADKQVLGDVPIAEVQDAFAESFVSGGREIDPEALEAAAAATYGYPFLIQLIGYHIWRLKDESPISIQTAIVGIEAARRRLGSLVHETALADLSDLDKTFLAAMSLDDGESRISDIRHRMGDITSQHANTYRERLLAARLITQAGRGKVDFALPYLRMFLREHSATYGLLPDGID
jgi:hypothetical protein